MRTTGGTRGQVPFEGKEGSMPEQTPESASLKLPDNPNLEWLRKQAKTRLAELRQVNPSAKLAEANSRSRSGTVPPYEASLLFPAAQSGSVMRSTCCSSEDSM